MNCRAKDIINAAVSLLLIYCFIDSLPVSATQYSVSSGYSMRALYNDNIFLTALPHKSVTGIDFSPDVKIAVKDINWMSSFQGKISSKRYSDHNLDGNDLYLNLVNNYTQERNIYSLTGTYNKDSNLNPELSDYGLTGRRVNRKMASLTPQYQRLITERLAFSASYNRQRVDYTNALATTYLPYNTNTLTGSLTYSLTERDKLSFVEQTSDYASKNDTFKYHLIVSQIGLNHSFSETLTSNISIGTSRRNSSNKFTSSINFFGQPIVVSQVSNYSDKGSVYDFQIKKTLQTGMISTSLSQNNDANSYGGLNVIKSLKFNFNQNISSLLHYVLSISYEKTKAVDGAIGFTNHETLRARPSLFYSIDRNWVLSAAYRYTRSKYQNNTTTNFASHSNMIYVQLRYNFPYISTF